MTNPNLIGVWNYCYEIGGKTGTAQLVENGLYTNKKILNAEVYISSANIKVDKKEKKFGIWMITESIKFSNVPKYY